MARSQTAGGRTQESTLPQPASCRLPPKFLEVILVVVVDRFFLDEIQLNWIQSYDLERNSTFFTIHRLAFVDVDIDVDLGITFRTRSGRHFFNLQGKFDYPRLSI